MLLAYFQSAGLCSVSFEPDTVQGPVLGTIMVLKGGKETMGLNLMETQEDPGLVTTKELTDHIGEKKDTRIWSLLQFECNLKV